MLFEASEGSLLHLGSAVEAFALYSMVGPWTIVGLGARFSILSISIAAV
jgi:hypothetical protein